MGIQTFTSIASTLFSRAAGSSDLLSSQSIGMQTLLRHTGDWEGRGDVTWAREMIIEALGITMFSTSDRWAGEVCLAPGVVRGAVASQISSAQVALVSNPWRILDEFVRDGDVGIVGPRGQSACLTKKQGVRQESVVAICARLRPWRSSSRLQFWTHTSVAFRLRPLRLIEFTVVVLSLTVNSPSPWTASAFCANISQCPSVYSWTCLTCAPSRSLFQPFCHSCVLEVACRGDKRLVQTWTSASARVSCLFLLHQKARGKPDMKVNYL